MMEILGEKNAALEILSKFSTIGANQVEHISTLGSAGAATANLINFENQDCLKRKHQLINCTDFCTTTIKIKKESEDLIKEGQGLNVLYVASVQVGSVLSVSPQTQIMQNIGVPKMKKTIVMRNM